MFIVNDPYCVLEFQSEVSNAVSYHGNRLELAVSVVNQIHQRADGSRRVKVICQSVAHIRFGLSQPEERKQLKKGDCSEEQH